MNRITRPNHVPKSVPSFRPGPWGICGDTPALNSSLVSFHCRDRERPCARRPHPRNDIGGGVGERKAKSELSRYTANSKAGVFRNVGTKQGKKWGKNGKKAGGKKMIVLQDRDKRILRYCYDQQFLMLEHVAIFFPDPTRGERRRGVQELEEAGFIKREQNPVVGRSPLIRLTSRGHQVAQANSKVLVPHLARLTPSTLIHDAFVTSVRMRLEPHWPDATFIPERALKGRGFTQIPDGVFYFPSGNGIALEIENSDKGKKRFCQLLERWEKVPSIVFVLFVVTHPSLESLLRRYLQEGPKTQPMGLVSWSLLRSSSPQVWTQKGEFDLFSRKSF